MLEGVDDHAAAVRGGERGQASEGRGRAAPRHEGPAQHFVNYVKQQLIDEYGSAEVFGGGLKVRTTIDLELQQTARDAISKWLTNPERPVRGARGDRPAQRRGEGDGRRQQLPQEPVQPRRAGRAPAGLLVQAVRARDRAARGDLTGDALRVEAADDRPRRQVLGGRQLQRLYLGSIDLEKATIESDNAVYAQLTQLVGSKNVAETARRMGIRSKLDGYFAIGLGAEAVNPLELARAYATLAYGGRRVDGAMFGNKPRVIAKVTERGRTRFNAPTKFDALTATEAGIENAILQKAVRLGTGKRAAPVDRPVAGKTGTTENYGDAWFVGYTPQLVVAVWVGYPTTLKPMLTEFHGDAVDGRQLPGADLEVLRREGAQGRAAPEGFPYPSTPYVAPKLVVRRGDRLLLDNGLCRSRKEVVYFAGKGPTQEGELPPERGRGARRPAS